MAVKIHSGELKHKVVFKQPTSSLNDEAGAEKSYDPPASTITTWAKVSSVNQFRATEAYQTALVDTLDFFVRHSTDREAITKDWLITYKGQDYTIHEIEELNQEERFIRFTAKVRTNG
jgi:SPP1 family predicted phage head-tail adaptor